MYPFATAVTFISVCLINNRYKKLVKIPQQALGELSAALQRSSVKTVPPLSIVSKYGSDAANAAMNYVRSLEESDLYVYKGILKPHSKFIYSATAIFDMYAIYTIRDLIKDFSITAAEKVTDFFGGSTVLLGAVGGALLGQHTLVTNTGITPTFPNLSGRISDLSDFFVTSFFTGLSLEGGGMLGAFIASKIEQLFISLEGFVNTQEIEVVFGAISGTQIGAVMGVTLGISTAPLMAAGALVGAIGVYIIQQPLLEEDVQDNTNQEENQCLNTNHEMQLLGSSFDTYCVQEHQEF